MTATVQQILENALELPDDQRASLAAELLASLPSPPAESRSDEEWIAEIERRAAAAMAGTGGLSWEQARAQVERRIRDE